MKRIYQLFFLILGSAYLGAQGLQYDPNFKPFYHGVASGDPFEDRVIIWTRITPDTQTTIYGNYIMARDTGLREVVRSGEFETDQSKDFTVKIDVTGLSPNATYYYSFTALGKRSQVGRTKTSPSPNDPNLEGQLRFAVVSCANLEGGYFNAYRKISERNDLDAVIHLGDYFYEYEPGGYRNVQLTDTNRNNFPPKELLRLEDYRLRYSQYHLEPELMNLHKQHPFILVWDDHEFANDSYVDGAENHQPNEGSWEQRKKEARQAFYEWLPVRGEPDQGQLYRSISYGQLMDLFMLDTRIEGRDKQPDAFDSPEDTLHPRKIMSNVQFNWLLEGLKNSKARWKAIGNHVIFSDLNVGFAASDPTDHDQIAAFENLFLDSWEGYLLQRNALIDSIRKYGLANTVLLSGDSHCSWAFDVTRQPVLYPLPQYGNLPQPNPYNPATGQGYNEENGEGSVGVEFCTPSISAANFAEELGSDSIAAIFEFFINKPIPFFPGNPNYNPHMKYVDLDRHGYMIFDVHGDSVQADFYYIPTVTSRGTEEYWGHGVSSRTLSNHISNTATLKEAPPKVKQDIPAPESRVVVGSREIAHAEVFGLYPNPACQNIQLLYGLSKPSSLVIQIVDLNGKEVKIVAKESRKDAGVYHLSDIPVSDVQTGIYLLQLIVDGQRISHKVVIKR